MWQVIIYGLSIYYIIDQLLHYFLKLYFLKSGRCYSLGHCYILGSNRVYDFDTNLICRSHHGIASVKILS